MGTHVSHQDITKFKKIRSNIQIDRNPQFSHASYDKIQDHHLTRRNATISQKFMDKEECKNSSTRRNAKIS
jgi:hypothetical protein